jgi:hypothetical protein
MITVASSGSFDKTEAFINNMEKAAAFASLERFGQRGVELLASATPTNTGKTAQSWTYTVERKRGRYSITWSNTNVVNGQQIAILIQFGHGTGTGGFVTGRDYINPALQPLFDEITDEVWRQVKNG